MTVLVTGGAGYIGSHTLLSLLDAGEAPLVVDNLSTGFRWAVPGASHFIHADIGDEATMAALMRQHRVRSLIHFAARTVVPDSVADPLGYYLANTVKSRALFAAAAAAGVEHVIFSSTAAVYGNLPSAEPVAESAGCNPESPYGQSKLMSEHMLRDACAAHGMRCIVLRYFNVAGADPQGRSGQSTANATHLIKVAVEAALGRRKQLDIFGNDYATRDGTCIRDYIHVTDLAAAHVMALAHLQDGGESLTLNCGYGRGYSVLEVVDAVSRAAGRPVPVRHVARRPGDLEAVVADSHAIRRSLGWQPRLDDLDAIVSHALAWERRLATRNWI